MAAQFLKSNSRPRSGVVRRRWAWVLFGIALLGLGFAGFYYLRLKRLPVQSSDGAVLKQTLAQEFPVDTGAGPVIPQVEPSPVLKTTNVVSLTHALREDANVPGPSIAPEGSKTNGPPTRTTANALESAELLTTPDRSPTNMLEAQIALTAYRIGSGSIDGVGGGQTTLALKAFQFLKGLEETGRLDLETQRELRFTRPLFQRIKITESEIASLRKVPSSWLGKSALDRLGHETLLERVAEQYHAHPNLIRRLNPSIVWDNPSAGLDLVVPNSSYPAVRRAALVRISLNQRYLRAFDSKGELLAHFPCSIGRIADKRPVGELKAVVVVKDPNYTFDPAVFPESEEAREIGRKLILAPGPNNPVGVAWIGLSRSGYGIHGTPVPEQVGRTESHGCFRLANWDAETLRNMVVVGTPIWVER